MIAGSWVNRGPNTPSPLIEKLALFWHNHFACGMEKVENSIAIWEQNQLFRSDGLGDFETLVQKVSVGGAMVRFLDNETNKVGAPQENFARELMELHTIGVGNFTENDVVEMARAWTGYGVVGWNSAGLYVDARFVYRAGEHDNGQKTIFGITRNWDGPATITELVNGSKRSLTAKFVARKLWLYYVNDKPTDAEVNHVANALLGSGMSIKAGLRAMLLHPTFWGNASRHAIVRPPVEWSVDVLRQMGIPAPQAELSWLQPKMGQYLFEPPSVAGWGTHEYWVSTAGIWGKGRFIQFIGWQDQVKAKFEVLEDLTPDEGVTYILEALGLGDDVSVASKAALRSWIIDAKAGYQWTLKHNALRIGAMLPEFQAA